MEYLNVVRILAAVSERLGSERRHNAILRQQVLDGKRTILQSHALLRRVIDGESITESELIKKLPAAPARDYIEALIGINSALGRRRGYYGVGVRTHKPPQKKTMKAPKAAGSSKSSYKPMSEAAAKPEVG